MLGGDWQKMHALYCNNIGNLTLTGYNPELSSKSFEEKLNEKEHGFLASSFGLNSYVKKQTEWSSLQIEEGGQDCFPKERLKSGGTLRSIGLRLRPSNRKKERLPISIGPSKNIIAGLPKAVRVMLCSFL